MASSPTTPAARPPLDAIRRRALAMVLKGPWGAVFDGRGYVLTLRGKDTASAASSADFLEHAQDDVLALVAWAERLEAALVFVTPAELGHHEDCPRRAHEECGEDEPGDWQCVCGNAAVCQKTPCCCGVDELLALRTMIFQKKG